MCHHVNININYSVDEITCYHYKKKRKNDNEPYSFRKRSLRFEYVFVAICDGIRTQFNFKVTDLIDRMSLTHINRTIKFHIIKINYV